MRYLLLISTLLPSLFAISAQTFQITEISPKKVGDVEEWFEFQVDETIDLSGYAVSNGKTTRALTPKKGTAGYYYVEKSPVSLVDSGGVIQIINPAGAVVHESQYPKTKGGTRKAYKWAEVWNWSSDFKQFVPMIYHNDNDPVYAITPGQLNHHLPTPADKFELKIQQVDFVNDTITISLSHGPKVVNLKQISIKHNGTILWQSNEDVWLKRDDEIVLHLGADEFQKNQNDIHTTKRSSVQQSAGSVELILHTGTSWQQAVDFVCWKEEILNKTETKRVDKYRAQNVWAGPCVSAAGLESLHRQKETNTATDFIPLTPKIVSPTTADIAEAPDWLQVLLQNEDFMRAIVNLPTQEELNEIPETEFPERKIVLPKIVRQRLERNLGLIWNWREAPWAEAVGSISDGAIDRNSERFLIGFGAP